MFLCYCLQLSTHCQLHCAAVGCFFKQLYSSGFGELTVDRSQKDANIAECHVDVQVNNYLLMHLKK